MQPFYVRKNIIKHDSLTELIKQEYKGISNNARLIIFYEKIRTNGKGTIRIDKNLCDDIYQSGDDCLIMQLKYVPRKNELFDMTKGGFGLLLASLGIVTPGSNLKVRTAMQRINYNS